MPYVDNEGVSIHYEVEGEEPPLVLLHGSHFEQATYLVLLGLLVTAQLVGVAIGLDPDGRVRAFSSQHIVYEFGFSQLRHLGLPLTIAWFCIVALVTLSLHDNRIEVEAFLGNLGQLLRSPLFAGLVASAAVVVFYSLKSEFVNPDGLSFQPAFSSIVPSKGAFVTHDEMWEFYIHSKFWAWSNRVLGWSVIESYQLVSAVAGGAFVIILIRLCLLLLPDQAVQLIIAVASGGFTQLFFGDVENYTLTAVLILLYIYTAILFLQSRLPITVPSLVLAVAITFHLLGGFLVPSLLYLYAVSWSRGTRRHVAEAALLSLAWLLTTLIFFDLHNLPIRDLFYHSHAFGQGGHIRRYLAIPSIPYYWQQVNLIALLFPAFLLIFPLLVFRRIPAGNQNRFLVISTVSLLAFQFIWKSHIGVYNDWNLYAAVAIPFSILVWYNFLRHVSIPAKLAITTALIAVAGMHSLTWIVSNHFVPYG